jgi:ketopantoate reductase
MKKGFNQVAVIGAGTMGHGLALLFALGGSAVRLVDVSQGRLDRAMELIRSHLSGLKLHREYGIEMEKVLHLIAPEPALGDRISESDFIVEAIVEKAEAKQALFHELGRWAGAETIVASTTSYMNVFSLAPEALQQRLLICPFLQSALHHPPGGDRSRAADRARRAGQGERAPGTPAADLHHDEEIHTGIHHQPLATRART